MVGSGDLKQAFAVINPMYLGSEKGERAEVQKLIKSGDLAAAAAKAKAKPLLSFKMVYDAPSSSVEPIYFWLLDFWQERYGGVDIEKVIDNFTAAPGSGHFAEMGARATRMQEEGMKILGLINQVVKTILNLVYDLKEFELRVEQYKDAESKDPQKKEAAILAIKQIWLDQVDIKKGNTSIKAMTFSQTPFSTLIDAFMVANSLDDIKKLDLNERVKRVLEQRLMEFNKWRELSQKEIEKRFAIEKSYLRTEVESLKLYTSWAMPYIKSAEQLRMKGFEKSSRIFSPQDPAMVNAFNTAMFEITTMAKFKFDLDKELTEPRQKRLPLSFLGYKMRRTYYAIDLITIIFRGIPQKVTQQAYGFGGRVEVQYDAYALNEEELRLAKYVLDKMDLDASINFIKDATQQSLESLKEDLDHFLGEKKEEKKKEEKKQDDINPFSAIADIFRSSKPEKKKEITELSQIKPDNYVEQYVRGVTARTAQDNLWSIYDTYKKARGMAAPPTPFDYTEGRSKMPPTRLTFGKMIKELFKG